MPLASRTSKRKGAYAGKDSAATIAKRTGNDIRNANRKRNLDK